MNEMQVSISQKNEKMGKIPSVSLPPVVACPHYELCMKNEKSACYAVRMYRNKQRKSIGASWDRNYSILLNDRKSYFLQIKAGASLSRFFRWHVSGDIIDTDYLDNMVKIARELKGTTFLAFTKSYEIVNDYLNNHRKPSNLKLILSLPFDGSEIDNRHNLPTAAVILKGSEPADNYKICGGHCETCACKGVGCWELKKGETIAFYEH